MQLPFQTTNHNKTFVSPYVWILVVLLWMSWLCSILIIGQCNFMAITTTTYGDLFADYNSDSEIDNQTSNQDDGYIDDGTTEQDSQYQTTQRKTFGLFTRPFVDVNDEEYSNTFLGCVRYNDASNDGMKDPKFRLGQSFGVMTVLLLTISSIILSTLTLCILYDTYRQLLWRVAHYITIGAAITQMLTFIALGSTDKCYSDDISYSQGCTLSSGGKLAIWNTLLLNGISLYWFFLSLPKLPFLQVRLHFADIVEESSVLDGEQSSPEKNNGGRGCIDQNNIKETIDETELSSGQSECEHIDSDSDDDQHDDNRQQSPSSIHDESSNTIKRTSSEAEYMRQRYQHTTCQFRFMCVFLFGIVWMVSIFGINRCTFISTISTIQTGELGDPLTRTSGIGLFQMAIYDIDDNDNNIFLGCVSYPDRMMEAFDRPFRTARIFGTIAVLLTSFALALNVIQLFHHRWYVVTTSISRFAIWMGMPFMILSEATTFTIVRSDICRYDLTMQCQLGGTGKMIIFNIVLMVILTILLLKVCPLEVPILDVTLWKKDDMNDQTEVSIICDNEEGINCDQSVKIYDTAPFDANVTTYIWLHHLIRIKDRLLRNKEEITIGHQQPIEIGQTSTRQFSPNNQDVPKPRMNKMIASIVKQVEYSKWEKKTNTITTYVDGSQMIETAVERLSSKLDSFDEYHDNDDSYDDDLTDQDNDFEYEYDDNDDDDDDMNPVKFID